MGATRACQTRAWQNGCGGYVGGCVVKTARRKRSDKTYTYPSLLEARPQVMIGPLVTGDGIPIAHRVFARNTNDAATVDDIRADLQTRFGFCRIAVVADRGLISDDDLAEVAEGGFD